MKVYVGSDHGGFRMKQKLLAYLTQKYTLVDVGAHQYDKDDDFTSYAFAVAEAVAGSQHKGILICRNGQGVCIAANKVKGVRAVTAMSVRMARSTRHDDNANILCLPAEYLTLTQAKRIITTWLTTPFSGQSRYTRRLRKIARYER